MGRKVEPMSHEHLEAVCAVVTGMFELLCSLDESIAEHYPKSAAIPRKYQALHNSLQEFKGLMELEVERSCLD